MLDLLQHASLVVGVLDLLHLDDLSLLQHLDCIIPLIMFRLDQVHSAEATGAQCALNSKVIEGVFALGDAGLGWLCRLRLLLLLLLLWLLALRHGAVGRFLLWIGLIGRVGRMYQVLYARSIVRGLLIGFGSGLWGRVGLLGVRRGVHGVGGLGRGGG